MSHEPNDSTARVARVFAGLLAGDPVKLGFLELPAFLRDLAGCNRAAVTRMTLALWVARDPAARDLLRQALNYPE